MNLKTRSFQSLDLICFPPEFLLGKLTVSIIVKALEFSQDINLIYMIVW